MSKKHTENNFLEGAILPSLLRFSIPVLLALVLQALYGAVDLWAVGKFGTTADISAVSTGSQVMQIVTGLITGLSMGTTIQLGQKIGAKDNDGAANAVGTSIKIFMVLGIILSIGMVVAAPTIATMLNAPAEAYTPTVHYLQICGAGTLCIVAYNLISAIFRGMGDANSPLVFVAIACVANIVGDIVLIDFFQMGAAGAAIATVAAQAISVVMSLVLIKKKGLPFHFEKANMRRDSQSLKKVLQLGTPIALQDMVGNASFVILVGIVNVLGVTASAGVGIAEKVWAFIFLIPMSFMQSISAFVAQNVGAKQYERAKKSMWIGMGASATLGAVMACITFFFGGALSSLFIAETADSPAVIAASAEFLKATAIEGLFTAIVYCFTGYFNGLGKTVFVMLQGLISTFLVRIPLAWYASIQPNPQLFEVGLAATYSAAFALLLCIIYYIWTERKKTQRENN